MGRLLAVLLALLGIGTAALAQRINTFYVDQYDGATVGEKVTTAQAACAPDTSLPCVLIFDTILAKLPVGTLPAKCAQCTWVDYSGLLGDAGKTRYNLVSSTAPQGTNYSIKTWDGGQTNITSQWGFNLSDNLYVAQNNSEPQSWWGLESNFANILYDNHPTMESYLRFMPIGMTINDPPGTGNYREPFFANFDRITNKIPELNLRGERIRLTPTDQQLDLTHATLPYLDMSSSGQVFSDGTQTLATLSRNGLTVGRNRILPTSNDVALALSGTTSYGFGWSSGDGPAVYFNGARVATFTSSGMTLPADPKNPLEAATKQYVDQRIPGNLGTDGLTVGVNRILPTNTGVALALSSTTNYGFGWSSGNGPAVYFNGARVATFTRSGITLPSDPKSPLEAATKQYVDKRVTAVAHNGSCTTSATAGSVCTFDVAWPSAFSNSTYIPTCIGQNPTGVPILGLTSLANDKITLYVQAATNAASGYGAVYCHAVQ